MADELILLKKKLDRERKSRKAAESLLESKALELYKANQRLEKFNDDLEQKIVKRSKELNASEQRYEALVNTASEIIFNLDEHGYITFINPAGISLLGYSRDELIGRHFQKLILPEYHDMIMAFYEKIKEDRLTNNYLEHEIRTKNGNKIWIGQSIQKLLNENDEIIYASIARDISLQKSFQTELEQAKYLAEEALKAETEYLANMSHEIRTPLNAIIGMIHLIEETGLNTEQREYLEVLQSSSNMLLSLVSDVLDISKIDAGVLEIQNKDFNVKHLVNDLIKTFSQSKNGSGIDFKGFLDSDIPRYVRGDAQLINQVLLNLLSNATKFTKEGHIHLYVNMTNQAKDGTYQLKFEVRDSGIGMSPSEIERIFKNFRQANRNIRNEYGGTGLGLAIAQKLVGLMGGEIMVDSTKGKGSSFSFSIIFDPPESDHSEEEKSEASIDSFNSKEITVLVVDDNDMNLKYITKLLSKWGINYNTAKNGKECVDQYKSGNYDMIFMDLQMPVMDGLEATQIIRNMPSDKAMVPIIALTASTLLGKKRLALEQGMTDYLSKPFLPESLKTMLTKHSNNVIHNPIDAKEYVFPAQLDTDYLNEVYENDHGYTKEMFETFLINMKEEFPKIIEAINQNDYSEAKAIAHKLKPTFTMVGLPAITDLMQKLEDALEKSDKKEITHLLEGINQKNAQYLPIIKSVIIDLDKIIKS